MNNNSSPTLTRIAVYLLVFQSVFLVYAAYIHRPLFLDGGWWFYKLMYEDHFIHRLNLPFYRYADAIWYLPSQIIFYFFKQDFSLNFGLRLGEILSQIFPLISLAFCLYALGRQGRPDLYFYPILGVVLGSIPVLAFATNGVTTANLLAWPLLLSLCFGDFGRRRDFFTSLFLILLFTFSYPLAIVYWSVFFYLLWKRRNFHERSWRLIVGLSALGIITQGWLLWREIAYSLKIGVRAEWDFAKVPFLYVAGVGIFGFILTQWFQDKKGSRQPAKTVGAVCVVLLIGLTIYGAKILQSEVFVGLMGAHRFRLFSPILTVLIMGLFALAATNSRQETIHKSSWWILISLQIAVALFDIRYSIDWTRARFHLEGIVGAKAGCVFLTEAPEAQVGPEVFDPWSIGFISVVWQMTRVPSYVVFIEDKDRALGSGNKCEEFFGNQLPETKQKNKLFNKEWKLDWSKIINARE